MVSGRVQREEWVARGEEEEWRVNRSDGTRQRRKTENERGGMEEER